MQDDDTSLSLLLFRYWWPFWLFRDASRGDLYARTAAYRYNRDRRVYLPGYLLRWTLLNCLTLALIRGCELAAADAGSMKTLLSCLTAWSGLLFVFGCTVVVNTAYIYLHLSRHVR